ncbi:MAG: hypothetical protein HC802_12445 [Caldilineaceae bacterium]|nr:hypothetical protein [Caldilineaceae bacterium]
MQILLTINGEPHNVNVHAGELLRTTLRRLRYFSVKHGDETGESGADAVLLTRTPEDANSYRLVNSGVMLAAQADGVSIVTAEGLSGPRDSELHPLQEQFVQCGAIQCGFCTPAQLLAAKKLLDVNPKPSEREVREAIAGVLCRCTGYLKPVQAILRAAAQQRGEDLPPFDTNIVDVVEEGEWPTGDNLDPPEDDINPGIEPGGSDVQTRTRMAPVRIAPPKTAVVNRPNPRWTRSNWPRGGRSLPMSMEHARHVVLVVC